MPATNTKEVRPLVRNQSKGHVMPAAKRCGSTALERSTCMIGLILADLKKNYGFVGGGGITSIRESASMSYTVELPQEERIDIFTYEFEMRGGLIAVKSKKGTVKSF
ncbi:MAG: hypothetical protein FWD67_09830 [Betaproteobacteria bacterium]|nr:hypothetical protein [Betaproteobacteria bacterium]